MTDRHGRKKWDSWVYAYWGITPQRVDWVKQTYRKRFGIETGYRQMNQCRIRTTTKKFNVRFLYVAIALLLRNLWVWLHTRPVEPAAGLPAPQLGSPAGGADAALAGTGGRGDVWTDSHRNNRKRYTEVSYDMTAEIVHSDHELASGCGSTVRRCKTPAPASSSSGSMN